MLSIGDCSRAELEQILQSAQAYSRGAGRHHPDMIVGLAFFEESLRTRVGFDTATARLGGSSTTVHAVKQTAPMGQPESELDTVRSVAGWIDVLCLRSADGPVVASAAEVLEIPVINCGNGHDEHPTQAIVDLLAILDIRGTIDGLSIALVGDLDGMRTTHSLALALARFAELSVRCISPPGLGLPDRYAHPLRAAGHGFQEINTLDLSGIDIVYVAGLPKPTRAGILTDAQQTAFRITLEVLARQAPSAHVLCPLPRIDEIAPEVDCSPQAAYFRQSALGLAARMAVLDRALSTRHG